MSFKKTFEFSLGVVAERLNNFILANKIFD